MPFRDYSAYGTAPSRARRRKPRPHSANPSSYLPFDVLFRLRAIVIAPGFCLVYRLGNAGNEFHEPLRVAWRLHFHVVVEIAVDVALPARRPQFGSDSSRVRRLLPGRPGANSFRPESKRRRRVAAHVDLLVAVEPHIHEI